MLFKQQQKTGWTLKLSSESQLYPTGKSDAIRQMHQAQVPVRIKPYNKG